VLLEKVPQAGKLNICWLHKTSIQVEWKMNRITRIDIVELLLVPTIPSAMSFVWSGVCHSVREFGCLRLNEGIMMRVLASRTPATFGEHRVLVNQKLARRTQSCSHHLLFSACAGGVRVAPSPISFLHYIIHSKSILNVVVPSKLLRLYFCLPPPLTSRTDTFTATFNIHLPTLLPFPSPISGLLLPLIRPSQILPSSP
jgi:hypothetical protein